MDPKRSKQLRQQRDKLDRRAAARFAETPENAMASAFQAFKRGDFDDCLSKCNEVIQAHPSHVAAHMLKGRTCLAKGDIGQAIHVVKSALESGIHDANLWCELGNLYSENSEQDNAVNAWRSSSALDASNFIAKKNLGFVLFELNRLLEAEQYLLQALELEPYDLPTVRTLAILWSKQAKFEQAADILEKALREAPSDGTTYKLLSSTYRSAGLLDQYQSSLERWLKAEPNNAIALHLMAGTREQTEAAPQRASDQYVREVFDQFAATFDADLAGLHYEAPVHIAAAMKNAYGTAGDQINPTQVILDAGCGTGICGPILRPYARKLIGVDLSSQMVNIAKDRACYDTLDVAELTTYLQQNNNCFDSIVACDTFNYFGNLIELFTACHSAMKNQGTLIITLEHEHQFHCEDYRLNINGRYTHSRSYVERAACASNLTVTAVEDVQLRVEADRPVQGLLFTLGKKS